jgi:hypothetical protein
MATGATPLTLEEIAAIRADVKTRGEYKIVLAELMLKDEQGFCLSDRWPARKPNTIKQGFYTQIKDQKLQNEVQVVIHDEKVYLLKN